MALFSSEEILDILKDLGGELIHFSHGSLTVNEVSTDTRIKMDHALFIALDGENFDAHNFLAAAVGNGAVIVCADKKKADKVPAGIPAVLVDSPLKAYQKLAEAYRDRMKDLKVIALTGSCGKTSTKEALRAIFCEAFGKDKVLATEGNTNNQIGVPRNLFRLTPEHRFAILEMGTNHPGEIAPLVQTAKPDAAIVVSIGSCHLEFFHDFNGVASEKCHIYSTLKLNSPAILPYDCHAVEILRNAAGERAAHILTFGTDGNADMVCKYLGGNLEGASFTLTDRTNPDCVKTEKVNWSIAGSHQAGNAAAAALAARAFGIELAVIARGLAATALPGMRMRKTDHNGALWINDAYNANPDSMQASLTWLSEFADPEKTLIVLGDMGELGPNCLKEHMKVLAFAHDRFPQAHIFCVGKVMTEALSVMKLAQGGYDMESFPDPESAAGHVRSLAVPGTLVFLKASRSTALEKVEPSESK